MSHPRLSECRRHGTNRNQLIQLEVPASRRDLDGRRQSLAGCASSRLLPGLAVAIVVIAVT